MKRRTLWRGAVLAFVAGLAAGCDRKPMLEPAVEARAHELEKARIAAAKATPAKPPLPPPQGSRRPPP